MTTAIPPGMMMMGNRLVPMSKPFGASKAKSKRFLVCIQFWEGDRDAAEDLAQLIAELERTRNHEADILLVNRADCRPMGATVKAKLAAKFDKVLEHRCRRSDAKGYPMGANQMFCDLVSLIGNSLRLDYYAFINLEPDCVPTVPGWIGFLIADWNKAQAHGKSAIGVIDPNHNPVRHLNGVAVYSSEIIFRVGGNRLLGCGPQVCYDIAFANLILPHAVPTPLLAFTYQKATITDDELYHSGAVIHHGVKDGSARAAVRARHITFTFTPKPIEVITIPPGIMVAPVTGIPKPEESAMSVTSVDVPVGELTTDIPEQSIPTGPDATHTISRPSGDVTFPSVIVPLPGVVATKRPNVYTYSFNVGRPSAESLTILRLWAQGWTTRGWNPVVLTLREAATHPRFEELSAAVEKLPFVGDRKKQMAGFVRWLALDAKGGGLLVDNDALPTSACTFSEGYQMLRYLFSGRVVGVDLSKEASTKWIETLIRYDAQPEDLLNEKPHVSDTLIAMKEDVAIDDMKLQTFTDPTGKEKTSVAMERFLGN